MSTRVCMLVLIGAVAVPSVATAERWPIELTAAAGGARSDPDDGYPGGPGGRLDVTTRVPTNADVPIALLVGVSLGFEQSHRGHLVYAVCALPDGTNYPLPDDGCEGDAVPTELNRRTTRSTGYGQVAIRVRGTQRHFRPYLTAEAGRAVRFGRLTVDLSNGFGEVEEYGGHDGGWIATLGIGVTVPVWREDWAIGASYRWHTVGIRNYHDRLVWEDFESLYVELSASF